MPINTGPGIGGRPGGSSFAPPTTKPAAASTKWVIAEAGVGNTVVGAGGSNRGPVTGSCIDILSDAWAWICAIGASGAVAYLSQQAAADVSSTSKWAYIGASFAGYLCATFIAGFAVAAFLWMGTKSKFAMRFGFTLVAALVALAPFAISRFRSPQASEAAAPAAAVEAGQPQEPAVQDPLPEPAPVVEQPAPTVMAPGPNAQSEKPIATTPPVTVRRPAPIRSTGPRQAAPRTAYNPSSAELKVVLAEVRALLGDIRGDATGLQEKLQAQGFDMILVPSSFAGRARIQDARRRLANIRRIADAYERTVIARFKAFPDRIRDLNISDELKQTAIRAFARNQAEGLRKLREIAQLDRAILVEADKLFAFMETRIGRYKVSDRILFQNIADAETYSAHVDRLQQLAAKEERAVVENQKAALSKLAAMERELVGARR